MFIKTIVLSTHSFFLFVVVVPSITSNVENKRAEDSFATRQLKLLSIFNNLNFCFRTADTELQETIKSFNPLDNLNLYSNPDEVKDFSENVDSGNYGKHFDIFYEFAFGDQINGFFNVIYWIDDWELLYKTAAYSSQKINTQLFNNVMKTLIDIKWRYFQTPPDYEIYPQMYTPKWIIRKANGDLRPSTQETDNPENVLKYWRNDPALSYMHINWHDTVPAWWSAAAYGFDLDRRGEINLYFHHDLVNRNRAERLSNGMKDIDQLGITDPIPSGDIPIVTNIDLTEMPARKPNQVIEASPDISIQDMLSASDRLYQSITEGFVINALGEHVTLLNNRGNDNLGRIVSAATDPLVNRDYYLALHSDLHELIALIGHPNETINVGLVVHLDQTVRDPAFFMIHGLVDDFNVRQQHKLRPYTKEELKFTGVEIRWIGIKSGGQIVIVQPLTLRTFFEKFTYDISNALTSCKKVNSGRNYTATIPRLNYQHFEYRISVFSQSSVDTRGIVRIYMAPVTGFDGKRYSKQELLWSMFEMDRFPITLKHGMNLIRRSSADSSVTARPPKGAKEIAAEVKLLETQKGKMSPFTLREAKKCGWPHNLLLPRGTEGGMQFKMFLIVTSNATGDYDEREFPSLPHCGTPVGTFPDGAPMGFPMNRRLGADDSWLQWDIHSNYRFIDIIIKHQAQLSNQQ